MSGLYIPDKGGEFRFKEAAEKEERPILTFEEDTGTILLNFNLILIPKGRKLRDVILQTHEGTIMGVVLTSSEMGPEEKKARGIK